MIKSFLTASVILTALVAFGARDASAQGTVSGQANNVIPLATGPTTIGVQSPLDVGISHLNAVTSSIPFAATVPLACTSTITTWSVSSGTLTLNYTGGNCAGNPDLSPGSSFVLANITGGTGCGDVQYTVSTNSNGVVTVPASGCIGSGTGGNFALQSAALALCNAANQGSDNCTLFWLDPDGSLFQYARAGASNRAGLHLDTTGYADLYVFGNGGGGIHADGYNTCIPAQGATDVARATCWDYNGYVKRFKGTTICNATAFCFGFSPEFWSGPGTTLNSNLSNYTLYTTSSAGEGMVGGAGLYAFDFALIQESSAPGNTLTITLSCVDPNTNPLVMRNYITLPFTFASIGDVAAGEALCYSASSSAIQLTFTHSQCSSSCPSGFSYFGKGSLWER